jgi:3-oxoacyl-[acyl-carrier protein] reductase
MSEQRLCDVIFGGSCVKLKDQVAVVTGAGRGIGRAIALQLAREGATLACWDIEEESAAQTAGEVEAMGRSSLSFRVDVARFNQVSSAVEEILGRFSRIDILVNNAGITRDNLLARMSEEEWNQVLDVNLKGTFNCTKAVVKQMMKQRSGRIVNIASVVGLMGNAGQANYCASKAGIIGFTKAVAKELASRTITVNAVAPGFIETEMTKGLGDRGIEAFLQTIPLRRLGKPEDVTQLVSFLVSEEAGYVTGQVINVDGGLLM